MKQLLSITLTRLAIASTLIFCVMGGAALAQSPSAVVTQSYDNLRSGVDHNESILNTSNVQPATFGRLFTRVLDNGAGGPRCQPLYVPGLTIQGATHNVVFVGTQGNYLYAFDADSPLASTLWIANLTPSGSSLSGAINLGLIATPVIDPATNTIYALSKTLDGPINRPASYVFRLHALNILTGQEQPNSPVVVNFSVPGTGGGSIRRVISMNPMLQGSKTALLLTQGQILFGFSASVSETNPNYHGYVAAYNAETLHLTAAWCSTPNASGGGVWQAAAGLMSDDQGNIWVGVGNGVVNPATNDLSEAVVRLTLSGSSLKVADYFIPNNYTNLNKFDSDLGVIGPIMLPGSKYMVQGSKTGSLYVLDPFNLGQVATANDASIPQKLSPGTGELHGRPVVYTAPDGTATIYYMFTNDYLRGYNVSANGLLDVTSAFETSSYGYGQGGFMVVSCNGTTPGTGILWCYHPGDAVSGNQTGVLDAYDASTTDLLWSSSQNIARDNCDGLMKWNYPTVANGKVYVGAGEGELVVYGLLNAGVPAAPTGLQATINNQLINLTWTAVPGAVGYNVRNSPVQGGPYSIRSFQQTGTTCNLIFKSSANNYNYFVVSAVNANGESANSAELAYSPWPSTPVISATSVNGVPTITWPAAAQAKSYSVLRGTQTGGPYTALVSGLTALSYTDSSVAANTTYYYVVTATNAFGTSANSNEVTN